VGLGTLSAPSGPDQGGAGLASQPGRRPGGPLAAVAVMPHPVSMPQRGPLVLEPRTFVDQLLDALRIPGPALVVTHDNPDPDSLASAYGIRALFQESLGRPTTIGYGGIIGRAENRAMVRACQIPVVPLELLTLESFTTLVLVDSQPQTGNNSLPATTQLDLVIDHHPLRDTTPERARWVDVRSDIGASATIVAQYLTQKEVPIDTLLATAFAYAIKSETQDLGVRAHALDREIYFKLLQQLDSSLLFEITHPKVSLEYFRILGDVTRKTLLFGCAAFTYIGPISNPDFVAEMADMVMRLEGIEWALCMGNYNGTLILSLRTNRETGGAGQMIQRLVRGLGQAGGHGLMAGGKVTNVPTDRAARQGLVDGLRERFLNEVGVQDLPARGIFDD
jgi:nanoRNase/pAp phosphatase (c-di-AMP/oligoRNAs hydrolase)